MTLSIKIFKKIHQKMKSLQILISSLLQTLSDHPRKKRDNKDGPFLWFATKCMCQATYDLNVEAISFAIGRGHNLK